jgi:hypothetical protein
VYSTIILKYDELQWRRKKEGVVICLHTDTQHTVVYTYFTLQYHVINMNSFIFYKRRLFL